MTLPVNSTNAYLPTYRYLPEDPQELLVVLNQMYTDIANAVNIRQLAQYDSVEMINGQQFFSQTATVNANEIKVFAYRKCFTLPATAAGATTNIAHGLTGVFQYTHIYGTCITDVVDYRPIPYAHAAAANQQIEIKILGANIVVVNGAAAPNITSGLIILEYTKNS